MTRAAVSMAGRRRRRRGSRPAWSDWRMRSCWGLRRRRACSEAREECERSTGGALSAAGHALAAGFCCWPSSRLSCRSRRNRRASRPWSGGKGDRRQLGCVTEDMQAMRELHGSECVCVTKVVCLEISGSPLTHVACTG